MMGNSSDLVVQVRELGYQAVPKPYLPGPDGVKPSLANLNRQG